MVINFTIQLIVLVSQVLPKLIYTSNPSQYRPIACGNVIYKLISKIINARLKVMTAYVKSLEQLHYFLDKQILGNILLF